MISQIYTNQKKYNNTQAVEIIQAELNATPERDEIIQFIENSPMFKEKKETK